MILPPSTVYLNEEYLDTDKYPVQTKMIKSFENAKSRGVEKEKVGVYIDDLPDEKLNSSGWEYIEYSNLLESLHKEDSIDFLIVTNLTSKLHHFNTPNKIEVEKDTYTHIALWVAKKLKKGGIMSTIFSKKGKDHKDYTFMRELTMTLRMAGFLSVVIEKKDDYLLYSGKIYEI